MEYELYHHGILGMKWGIRRFQNPDGSLTPAGRRRLAQNSTRLAKATHDYEKANILQRPKARDKYYKALDKHEAYLLKLGFNRMNDADAIKSAASLVSRNANQSISSPKLTANVASGQEVLKKAASIFTDLGTIGTGVKNIVGGINAVRGLRNGVKMDKEKNKDSSDDDKKDKKNPNTEKSNNSATTTSKTSQTKEQSSPKINYDSMHGTATAKAMAKVMNAPVDKNGNVTVNLSHENIAKWYYEQMHGQKKFKVT